MAKDICVAFGEQIRQLRKERGWRQIDFAEETGIHENYVTDLELGKKEVCLRTLHRIAKSLKMSMSELLKTIE
jgi:XRE family aerobic/anaerobic benzoate catabolism transcriptional regulator